MVKKEVCDAHGLIIPYYEVGECVYTANKNWWIVTWCPISIKNLNDKLLSEEDKPKNNLELEEWLKKNNIQFNLVLGTGNYLYREYAFAEIIYDGDSGIFLSWPGDEVLFNWRYWDNYRPEDYVWYPRQKEYVWYPEYSDVVVIDQYSKIDLDYWDGSKWVSPVPKKKSYFNSLYEVLEINGEPVEDKWLIFSYTLDEYRIPTGKIVSGKKAKKNFKNLEKIRSELLNRPRRR